MMRPRTMTTVSAAIATTVVMILPSLALAASNASQFDIFELSLRTREGFCASPSQSCPKLPKGKVYPLWTINGLWPAFSDGSAPPQGCSNVEFAPSDVQVIRCALDNFWPSYTASSSEMLWRDEFTKHGTCATFQNENLATTLRYFVKAIDLYTYLDVTTWLDRERITPSNKKAVHVFDIKRAIFKSFTNGNFELYCDVDRDGREILQEIRLCVDRKTYLPTNCHEKGNKCRGPDIWYLNSAGVVAGPSIVTVLVVTVLAYAFFKHDE